MLSDIKRAASFLTLSVFLAASSSCSSSVGQAGSSEAETTSAVVSTEEAAEAQPTESAAEKITEKPEEPKEAKAGQKGNIYDVKGRLLVSGEAGKRVYADDYAVSCANLVTEMSEGYDTSFEKILNEPVNDSDVGKSIELTIDADIQNAVYNYMQSTNLVGSVVAMRTDGSLLAQVSYPSYDPRTVTDQKYDEKLAWGESGNKAFQNFEPGSCFKIMSEVIADKHGFTSCYDEGEWKFDGTSIVNWDHDTGSYPVENRTLQSAFINSSNIFFAKAFDNIGSEAVLSDLDSIFHFVTPIDCDFGEIKNNVEIYCEDDLRRTAFGQSYVLTCPLYLAALGREAAFGDMVKPFVLKDIVDTNDSTKVLEEGSAHSEVIASIPQEYRQNLQDGMRGVAGGLGVYVPQGYTLYAKTGTAETWENDFLYITGCVKNDSDDGSASYTDYSSYNGSYVIVMQVRNPSYHGFEFASHSANLYQGVVNAVLGN